MSSIVHSTSQNQLYITHLQSINNVNFTIREIDIISCFIHNKVEKKITNLLSISNKALKKHTNNITTKLQAKTISKVIEIVKNSEQISYIYKYYKYLLMYNTFKIYLKKIGTNTKKEISIFVYNNQFSSNDIKLFNKVKNDLKLANILLILKNDNNRNTNKNITILTEETLKDIKDQYFISIFNYLKKINYTTDINLIINEFFTQYYLIKNTSLHPDLIKSSLDHDDKDSTYKTPYFFNNRFAIKIVLFFICILILFVILEKNITSNLKIRPIFAIPNEEILLSKELLIKEIEKKFNSNSNKINIITLIGPSGVGKTTIARQYAQKLEKNYDIIWEINAKDKKSILTSLLELAFHISKSKKEKLEIDNIQIINDYEEKNRKLLLFLQKATNKYKNWLMIYNNVSSLEEIQNYIPYDKKKWGNGKIIITTQDTSIVNNKKNNCIIVNNITQQEKTELFNKILSNSKENDNNIDLTKLINNIPSLPIYISAAAHYIKSEGISYRDYLDNITKRPKSLSNYITKNNPIGYNIITASIDSLIKKDPKFKNLLIFTTLLGPNKIWKQLLVMYKNEVITNKFINQLKKLSLIVDHHHDISNNNYNFLIHNITHEIILNHLKTSTTQSSYNKIVNKTTNILVHFIKQVLNEHNNQKYELLIPNIESFIQNNKNIDKLNYARLIHNLGKLYFNITNYTKAQTLIEKAYQIYKTEYGENNINTGYITLDLSTVYRNMGYYIQAKNLLQKALVIYTNFYGKNNINTTRVSLLLGNIYRCMGNYEDSSKLITHGVKIYHQYYNKNHPEYYCGSIRLANIYNNLGYYNESIKLLKQALAYYTKYHGPYHIKTAWVAVRLSIVYRHYGYYNKALDLITKAIKIYSNYSEECNINTTWAWTQLGIIYQQIGRTLEAQKILEQSLKNYQKYYPQGDISLEWIKFHLSNVYKSLNLYDEAKKLKLEVLDSYTKYYGENHIQRARVLKDLGELEYKNNIKQGKKYIKQALYIFQEHNHISAYTCYEALSDIYLYQSYQYDNQNNKSYYRLKSKKLLEKAIAKIKFKIKIDSTHLRRLKNKSI